MGNAMGNPVTVAVGGLSVRETDFCFRVRRLGFDFETDLEIDFETVHVFVFSVDLPDLSDLSDLSASKIDCSLCVASEGNWAVFAEAVRNLSDGE